MKLFMNSIYLYLILISHSQPISCYVLPDHPRLILTPSRLVDVKAFINNNTQAASYMDMLLDILYHLQRLLKQ
jgi:hypothetical protein